jgi:hypothetical protein
VGVKSDGTVVAVGNNWEGQCNVVDWDLSLEPATLSVLIPAAATEGDGVLVSQGTVNISEVQGTDLTVFLSSSDTTEVTVPATVEIPQGSNSANFDLTILDDLDIDGTRTVTINASVAGVVPANETIDILDNDDTDIDSLPDWWEIQYFGNLKQDGTGDFDGDGFTNLREYRERSDPTDSNSPPKPKAMSWIPLLLLDD